MPLLPMDDRRSIRIVYFSLGASVAAFPGRENFFFVLVRYRTRYPFRRKTGFGSGGIGDDE